MVVNEATPESVQGENISFDDNGQLQFTDKGLDAFKDLLKEGTHGVNEDDDVVLEKKEQDPEEETKATEPEPQKEPQKRILKVDGQDIEVTEDELIALAQQGRDYTRKTQQLAEERNALAPYDALIKQLQTDPNLSKHLANYFKPQTPVEPQKPQFEDPIEQLKWETKQEALAEMRKEFSQTVAPMSKQMALNQVRQQVMADPDYAEVHQAIINMVQSQPPTLQKAMYMQLDQDPITYVEAFQHFKGQIKQTASVDKKPEGTLRPEPVKRIEKAPILESSDSTAPDEASIKAQRSKIDKAKAKALRSGSVDALQDFLEVGGFLKHLA